MLKADGAGWRLDGYKNYFDPRSRGAGVSLVWCRWPGGDGAKGIGAVVVEMPPRPAFRSTGVPPLHGRARVD